MNRGIFIDKPQSVAFREVEERELRDDEIRIQTEFASIKHGTEFTLFSGKSPFHGRRFDGQLRLFVPTDPTGPQADAGMFIGNTVVGTVIEIGGAVRQFMPGDRVYGYHPAMERAVLSEAQAHPLLPPMSPQDAVCLDPASVAYAALRDGRITLGDNVIVFGMGAIGLFLVQMLRLAGCDAIIAVDPIEKRRQCAAALGASAILNPTKQDVALETRNLLGAGADIAIEASGKYPALQQCFRSVRMCARVVTLGYYTGKDSELELGAEWFHNRLEMICSLPHWGNPLRDYPLWDLPRLESAVTRMFLKRQLNSDAILDPVVRFEETVDAFQKIYRDPSQSLKLGIRFSGPA